MGTFTKFGKKYQSLNFNHKAFYYPEIRKHFGPILRNGHLVKVTNYSPNLANVNFSGMCTTLLMIYNLWTSLHPQIFANTHDREIKSNQWNFSFFLDDQLTNKALALGRLNETYPVCCLVGDRLFWDFGCSRLKFQFFKTGINKNRRIILWFTE